MFCKCNQLSVFRGFIFFFPSAWQKSSLWPFLSTWIMGSEGFTHFIRVTLKKTGLKQGHSFLSVNPASAVFIYGVQGAPPLWSSIAVFYTTVSLWLDCAFSWVKKEQRRPGLFLEHLPSPLKTPGGIAAPTPGAWGCYQTEARWGGCGLVWSDPYLHSNMINV